MRDETYRPTPDGASGDADDQPEQQAVAPDTALTWQSPAERNKVLSTWRRAVFWRFAAKPRSLRLAWVLRDLFHVRDCYAFPRNSYLAAEAGPRKVQETMAALEHGGAILRATIRVAGKRRRVIYPGAAVVERAARHAHRGACLATPTVGHAHRGASSNKRKNTPRAPRTQREVAQAAAELRERNARERTADAAGAAAPDAARCAAEGMCEAEPAEGKAHSLTRKITAARRACAVDVRVALNLTPRPGLSKKRGPTNGGPFRFAFT
jgi:hypothetical protein